MDGFDRFGHSAAGFDTALAVEERGTVGARMEAHPAGREVDGGLTVTLADRAGADHQLVAAGVESMLDEGRHHQPPSGCRPP